jgi:hypothetical protein
MRLRVKPAMTNGDKATAKSPSVPIRLSLFTKGELPSDEIADQVRNDELAIRRPFCKRGRAAKLTQIADQVRNDE